MPAVILGAVGAVVLVVFLGPAVILLLPPNGLHGLDMYALWSAARLPLSLVLIVPAAVAVAETVRRWRGAGDPAAVRRRTRILAATTLAILVPLGVLVAVDAAQPACGEGRTCVATAGISFVLPGGWSRAAPEKNELYAATAGDEQLRFVIEDGARVLRDAESTVPTDIDGVATQVQSLIEGGGGLLSSHTGIQTTRIELPVGPAVRVSYTGMTAFILVYYQTTITVWFFVDGRLVVLEYMHAYGEGTPGDPSTDPPDFAWLLESLRAL